jgi:hypothetical protein
MCSNLTKKGAFHKRRLLGLSLETLQSNMKQDSTLKKCFVNDSKRYCIFLIPFCPRDLRSLQMELEHLWHQMLQSMQVIGTKWNLEFSIVILDIPESWNDMEYETFWSILEPPACPDTFAVQEVETIFNLGIFVDFFTIRSKTKNIIACMANSL